MSGHNKWSTTKNRKNAQDSKKGKIFTKLTKEIKISIKLNGTNPDLNSRLRAALSTAKSENMPKENIERAIKKGSGILDNIKYEKITYEGYGPEGSAIMIECLTNNRNRTVSEIRHIFRKFGGNLGETGCVNWLLKEVGFIEIENSVLNEDKIFEIALESGAEDVFFKKNLYCIITSTSTFDKVKKNIKKSCLVCISAKIKKFPKNKRIIKKKEKLKNMVESLYECDDVTEILTDVFL